MTPSPWPHDGGPTLLVSELRAERRGERSGVPSAPRFGDPKNRIRDPCRWIGGGARNGRVVDRKCHPGETGGASTESPSTGFPALYVVELVRRQILERSMQC